MEIVGPEAAAAAVAAPSIQSSISADEDSRASLHDYRSHAHAPSPRLRLVLTRCSGLGGCRGLLYSSVDDNHTLLRMEK